MLEKRFRIKDPIIVCQACTGTIDHALKPHLDKTVKYRWDEDLALILQVSADNAEKLKNLIQTTAIEVGFFEDCSWEEMEQLPDTSAIDTPSPTSTASPLTPNTHKPKTTVKNHLFKGLLTGLIGAIWICSDLLPWSNALWLSIFPYAFAAISTVSILYAGWEIFQHGWLATKRGHLTMNTQFLVSVSICLVISWTAFEFAVLPQMFEAAAWIICFRLFGLVLEEWSKNQIDQGDTLLDSLPQEVEVISELTDAKSNFSKRNIYTLQPGEKVRIMPGMVIPTDGECFNEEGGWITEQDFSGQSDDLKRIKKNDKLLQGYKATSEMILLVKKKAAASTQAMINSQVQEAAAKRLDTSDTLSFIKANFVKIIFAISLFTFLFISCYAYFFASITLSTALILALKSSIGMLVTACPCTLGSIGPLIGSVGTFKCGKNGATLLDANVLNTFLECKKLVIDLNGTSTTGEKLIQTIRFLKPEKVLPAKILAHLKFMQQDSEHLLGKAIYNFLNQNPENVLNKQESKSLQIIEYGMGRGLLIGDKELAVGSKDLLKEKGISLPKLPPLGPMMQRNYIIYGETPNNDPEPTETKSHQTKQAYACIGYIDTLEPLRPEARDTLDYFRGQGYRVILCTGSPEDTAIPYAEALGFTDPDDIKTSYVVKPTSKQKTNTSSTTSLESKEKETSNTGFQNPKAEFIKSVAKKEPVIYMGDAGNDSQPISEATVGIVGDSPTMSEANKRGANVYIGKRSLQPLVRLHAIAKQTRIMTNLCLAISLIYNLAAFIFMGGLSVFWLGVMIPPELGAAIMGGQALVLMLLAAVFQAWPAPNPLVNIAKKYSLSAGEINAMPSIIFGDELPRPTYNHLLTRENLGESKSLSLSPGIPTKEEGHIPSPTQPLLLPENTSDDSHSPSIIVTASPLNNTLSC